MMSLLNEFKMSYLRHNVQLESFKKSWPIWKPLISQHFTKPQTGKKIFDLGDNFREIFKQNKQPGRSQSSLTSGGTAWECLLVWYLNLLFWDTPVIAVRMNRKFVPKEIINCITVSIGNHRTNSETDILIFSIPDAEKLENSSLESLSHHLSSRVGQVVLLLLQCKTNWNDNSQIPMLWNLIYRSHGFDMPDVNIGIEGLSPASLHKFYYGFVSAPSNQLANFKTTSLSVLRVRQLTGGNYWGHRTTPDIAANIKELPGRYFSSYYEGGVTNHLDKLIKEKSQDIHNFINLNW